MADTANLCSRGVLQPKKAGLLPEIFQWIIYKIFGLHSFLNECLQSLINNGVKPRVTKVLNDYDIEINGTRAWDIRVKNEKFYNRLASDFMLGLGESYMDELWDTNQLDETMFKLFRGNLHQQDTWTYRFFSYCLYQLLNRQTKDRAFIVGQEHYDLGNELYEKMLDSTMAYSCGYWKTATDLHQAQLDKLKLLAEKLKLEPGMKVLDIGCGWGSLCKYLAENYDVKVVGVTISAEQVKLAQERCKGLEVDIRLCDYRDVYEKFDRIVSVGMLEHVGQKNLRDFFEVTNRCLTDDGLVVVHTMGVNHPDFPVTFAFADKYIFPNGMFPRLIGMMKSIDGLYVLEDLHNFGHDYYTTLMAWDKNFDQAWPQLSHKYGKRFYRMWKFYLLSAAGLLKSRKVQVWHFVLSKNGVNGGYRTSR